MREILFRGKRVDNGEWVLGSLIVWCDGSCSIETGSLNDTAPSVDPATVGQYTGLTDKNGKRIFEGDILIGTWGTKIVIYFDEDYLQFRAREVSSYAKMNAIDYYNNGKMEVIGNVHDNPELLEVEK